MARKVIRESAFDENGNWKSNEDMMKFNDKYFPRIDIDNKERYETEKIGNRLFAYDKEDKVVDIVFKDDEEVDILGDDKAPWRIMDSVGLSEENWNDKEARIEYLQEYSDDLDYEADSLAQQFIRDELPMYQKDKDGNKEWSLYTDM